VIESQGFRAANLRLRDEPRAPRKDPGRSDPTTKRRWVEGFNLEREAQSLDFRYERERYWSNKNRDRTKVVTRQFNLFVKSVLVQFGCNGGADFDPVRNLEIKPRPDAILNF
jgi:hypothetical protein